MTRAVDGQLEELFTGLESLQPIHVGLLEAIGCYVARDVVAYKIGEPDRVVLPAGALVTTRQLARVASAGISAIEVAPRPRVVVLSLGDEPASPTAATALVIAAASQEAGAEVYRASIHNVEARTLRELLEDQLVRADVLVVIGGAEDAIRPVLDEALTHLGEVPAVDLATEPAISHGFGRIGNESTPVFVFPVSALSAYALFEMLLRPFLRVLAADPAPFRPTVKARVRLALASPVGRQEFRFGRIEVTDGVFEFAPLPAVEPLTVLAESTALGIIPAEVSAVEQGSSLLVIPLTGSTV